MSLSRSAALVEIRDLFDTAWAGAGPVKYDNVTPEVTPFPPATGPWSKLFIRHAEAFQATIQGETGNRRFRRTGLITAQIFQDPGAGLTGATDLSTIVRDAFEGVTSPGGIIFRQVATNEIGPDGDFFQTNVVAFFEYDEQK